MPGLHEDRERQLLLVCDAVSATWAVDDAEERELGDDVLIELRASQRDVLAQLEAANFRAMMRALAYGILAEPTDDLVIVRPGQRPADRVGRTFRPNRVHWAPSHRPRSCGSVLAGVAQGFRGWAFLGY